MSSHRLCVYVCVCVQTTILELKKLVYLYMIAYAETDPETVVMSVNSFVKDASTVHSPRLANHPQPRRDYYSLEYI